MRSFHPAAAAAAVIGSLLVFSAADAGPLDPPSGPVASTFKTLTEVEPRIAVNSVNTPGDSGCVFKITQPGSYYLTGNLSGAGRHGVVEIAASNVTLDLGGFSLTGSFLSGAGVFSDGSLTGVTVRNGAVSGWNSSGVDLSSCDHSIIENIDAHNNGGAGIRTGHVGVLRSCVASSNDGIGFDCVGGGAVDLCLAAGNTGNGFSGGDSAVLHGCVSRENLGAGFRVINAGLVTDCSAYSNGGAGIVAFNGSVIERCASAGNTGDGISVQFDSTIRGNTCEGNGGGLGGSGANIHVTGTDNRVDGNTCVAAGKGVDVDFAHNILIRNTCTGNTVNWDIAAGNAVAPIVHASTNAGAIHGDTYSGSLGNSDPNANFTY